MKHEPVTLARLWSTYCFFAAYGVGRGLMIAAVATTATALLLAGLGADTAAYIAAVAAIAIWVTSGNHARVELISWRRLMADREERRRNEKVRAERRQDRLAWERWEREEAAAAASASAA